MKDMKIFLKKKDKRQKRSNKNIKILLKKKKKNVVSIIRYVSRSYVSIEEIIIKHLEK